MIRNASKFHCFNSCFLVVTAKFCNRENNTPFLFGLNAFKDGKAYQLHAYSKYVGKFIEAIKKRQYYDS